MERTHDEPREDVDPADALGGAGALPMPEGQPRGFVPTDRDEPASDAAPEATDASPGNPPRGAPVDDEASR